MLQAQLTIQRPVQVVLEQVEGDIVLIFQHRLRYQPVQFGAVADKARVRSRSWAALAWICGRGGCSVD
jgi:hypothetical protein